MDLLQGLRPQSDTFVNEIEHLMMINRFPDWLIPISYRKSITNSPPPSPPLCVEMGFTWTFPRNQDATLKLKAHLLYLILVVF